MDYSISLQFYFEEHYSEIAPYFVDPVFWKIAASAYLLLEEILQFLFSTSFYCCCLNTFRCVAAIKFKMS